MKYPSAWTDKQEQPVTTTAKKIVARIDMSAEVAGVGKCPECKQLMKIVNAAGSRMWTCEADRITLPLPDGYEEKS